MPETLRKAITDFCDNTEEWFSGKDILLFVKSLRGILETHQPDADPAAVAETVRTALGPMILALERASGSLQTVVRDLDEAVTQAKDILASP